MRATPALTPLHWAAGTWEGGVSNPVYGFSDPMSGLPNRSERLQLIKALLAHGANPNARMTKRPFIGGGYEDARGRRRSCSRAPPADVEIMKLLLAAGADPKLVTDTKATAVMAVAGLNRSVGESALTEPQVLAAAKLLFELGLDARGATTDGRERALRRRLPRLEHAARAADREGRQRQRDQQGGDYAVARGLGLRRPSRRRALQHRGRHDPARSWRRSEAGEALPGPGEVRSPEIGIGRGVVSACAAMAWLAAVSLTPSSAVRAQAPAAATTPAATLVSTYCVSCHNDRAKVGGFSLAGADATQVGRAADAWEKVIVKLRSRSMPPAGMKRPDNATYDTVSAWLEQELDRAALAAPNPGRPADLHRLNRGEYANAIRDLLGIDVDATALLPPDTQAFGFDTNADALSMEPALLDRYLTAAAKIARIAVGDPSVPPAVERYTAVPGNANEQTWLWQTERLGEEFPLGSRGGIARVTTSRWTVSTTCGSGWRERMPT
jgi:mono/diheme cytochrome c family protein